ncbi:ABC transporter permease subunit [Pseudoroseomonas wenyumeiae]|uniref:ABC transporter permease subunit n=1 Tax=Teichococcus wenyumeiae TaxID=2478470 RepID=A0A3A9JCA8_9PROT|nr:ABC transporter permease subunit [Pseudoroseomonas wenyumeiae]RKK04122.1 ABC transporter permease subunit [Pseudoroseomonas wenyumeiae]RMI17158.1 ABC transporter permease subunit [Pseudoroseomonas wenyumeiae]
MLNFIFRRFVLIIPTLVGVTLASFILIRAVPGDPIEVRMGERGITAEQLTLMRQQLGLDQPLWKQFLDYEAQLVSGHLGNSSITHAPVWDEFLTLFPATLELALAALIFAAVLGTPLGVVAAVRRGTVLDYGLMAGSVTGASMPIFWWGLIMILIFSVTLGWTPVSGRISDMFYVEPWSGFMLIDAWFSEDKGAVWSALSHLILPMIVLGTIPLATIARMTRSAMLEVLGEDYIRTARAKGLKPSQIVFVHALRNALIPVVTVIGLQVGSLLSGAILTETIFAWPGVGRWLIEAIQRRDYPVLQSGTLLIAILVMAVNLGVDMTYGFLNPRIRH